MEYVVTFHTHFDALQYNRFLKKNGRQGKLQPVPRALSSSCGTCIRFSCVDLTPLYLEPEFERLFRCEKDGFVLVSVKDT